MAEKYGGGIVEITEVETSKLKKNLELELEFTDTFSILVWDITEVNDVTRRPSMKQVGEVVVESYSSDEFSGEILIKKLYDMNGNLLRRYVGKEKYPEKNELLNIRMTLGILEGEEVGYIKNIM